MDGSAALTSKIKYAAAPVYLPKSAFMFELASS
jgi:hypothetical protein